MPDLWGKIESKLEDKKKKNNKKILAVAASMAIIFTIGIAAKSILINDNNIKAENNINKDAPVEEDEIAAADGSETSINIEVLPDLNLEDILKDKIVESYGISNAYIARDIDIEKESAAIVYGKVTEVKSYLQDNMINSYLSIEVIKDYKGNIKEGEKITVGSSGGEMFLEEYNKESSYPYILSSEAENGKDEGKRVVFGEKKSDGYKIIALSKGVPQYREGEYVLVYLFEIDKEGYYSWKDEKYYEPPAVDYGIYSSGKLYVNPNTGEVFNYTYDYISEKLIKEKVTTLDALENRN